MLKLGRVAEAHHSKLVPLCSNQNVAGPAWNDAYGAIESSWRRTQAASTMRDRDQRLRRCALLRDDKARPQEQRRPQRRTGSQETTEAAHPRLDNRGSRQGQLQCTIPSGAKVNGPASCARRTGRATPTSSGRPGRRRTRRPSVLVVDNVPPARPCLRRSGCTGTRSAIPVEVAGTAPQHLRDVIRTRDEPPRTTGGDAALSRQLASKLPSSVIDPNPPRPLEGRSGTR